MTMLDLKDLVTLFGTVGAIATAAWVLQAQLGSIRESIVGVSQRINHLESQAARLADVEKRTQRIELRMAAYLRRTSSVDQHTQETE